ncbi:MAG: hypothetical protein ABSG63_07240 [Spirochaetia bacterium]|jgi:AraC-like DNA-binding protein
MKGNAKTIKDEFVAVPFQTLKDTTLNNAQLGFLTRLLSKPPEWEYRPKQIAAEFGMCPRTVYKMFEDLAAKGYIVRHDIRMQDDKGLWSRVTEYRVYASTKHRLDDEEASLHKVLPFQKSLQTNRVQESAIR